MSFKEKYIKYKSKYLLLKNKIKQSGGNHELYMAVVENNSIQVNDILHRMDIDGAERIDLNYKPPEDFRNHKDCGYCLSVTSNGLGFQSFTTQRDFIFDNM